MAGFQKEEPYFVPEVHLELPHDLRYYEKILLPELEDWTSQAKGRGGDHSQAADNFLNHVIPFLLEVLIQDGIYFIMDHPDHPMSETLKKIPAYEQWADSAQATVQRIAET